MNEQIQKAYELAVGTALELYPLCYPRRDDELHLPGRAGAIATYENRIVKFTVPEIPHLLRKDDPSQTKLKNFWIELICYAHAKAEINVQFQDALCLIKVSHTLHTPWDIDNRVYKHIVNAIRFTRLIPDDSSKHLSLMTTGVTGAKEQKTEIYVMDIKEVTDKFTELNINLRET